MYLILLRNSISTLFQPRRAQRQSEVATWSKGAMPQRATLDKPQEMLTTYISLPPKEHIGV